VANEIISLQEQLAGQQLDRSQLIDGMVRAFNGDLEHKCMGRSAAARLQRALELADEYALDLPRLKEVASAS
jgi:hypothetical protein